MESYSYNYLNSLSLFAQFINDQEFAAQLISYSAPTTHQNFCEESMSNEFCEAVPSGIYAKIDYQQPKLVNHTQERTLELS